MTKPNHRRVSERMYMPSDCSSALAQATFSAFEKAPQNERKTILELGDTIRFEMLDRTNRGKVGFGPEGMIELLGKIGIWMVEEEL